MRTALYNKNCGYPIGANSMESHSSLYAMQPPPVSYLQWCILAPT